MKGEDESNAWKKYAMENTGVLTRVIKEITQEEEKLLTKLLESANTISKTSLGSLSEDQKADLERLLREASVFVIVFWFVSWQPHKKHYDSLPWPPPKLRKSLNKLADTVCSVHKFIGRKCEKNLVKRVLVGYFGMRDLGKMKRYQRRLDSVEFRLESKPHNINIYDVLVKVVNSRAQPQSQNADTQFSEEGGEGDTPVNKEKGACAANEKPEGTILGKVEKSITKSANQKVKPRDAEEDEQKVFKTKDNAKDNSEDRSVGDIWGPRSHSKNVGVQPQLKAAKNSRGGEEVREREDREKAMISEEPGEVLEDTAAGKTNNPAQSKMMDRRKMKSVPTVKRTAPVVSPHSSISSGRQPTRNTTSTNGPGTIINRDIGNTMEPK